MPYMLNPIGGDGRYFDHLYGRRVKGVLMVQPGVVF
jgi:hypothetical protein